MQKYQLLLHTKTVLANGAVDSNFDWLLSVSSEEHKYHLHTDDVQEYISVLLLFDSNHERKMQSELEIEIFLCLCAVCKSDTTKCNYIQFTIDQL